MDSLASIELACEPSRDAVLTRDPVNRSESIITKRMWTNMLGQAFFQVLVTLFLHFQGTSWFDMRQGYITEKEAKTRCTAASF